MWHQVTRVGGNDHTDRRKWTHGSSHQNQKITWGFVYVIIKYTSVGGKLTKDHIYVARDAHICAFRTIYVTDLYLNRVDICWNRAHICAFLSTYMCIFSAYICNIYGRKTTYMGPHIWSILHIYARGGYSIYRRKSTYMCNIYGRKPTYMNPHIWTNIYGRKPTYMDQHIWSPWDTDRSKCTYMCKGLPHICVILHILCVWS